MNQLGKRFFCVSVMLLMVLACFVMLAGTVGQKGVIKNITKSDRTNTRAGDYVSLNDPLGTYYPGDLDNTFTITVSNDYDGSEWNDGDAGDLVGDYHWPFGDGYVTCVTKITIEAVRDADHNPPAKDPLINFDKTVFNAPLDAGYNISGSQTYRHNEDGDPFSFDVDTKVTPGDYTLQVRVTYYLRLSWDNTNTKFLTSTSQTETEWIEFTIVSGLEPAPFDNEIDAEAYDNDGDPLNGGFLYAGSTFQEIRIPVTAKNFDMDSVQATLNPVGITLSNTEPAKISHIGAFTTSYLAFRIEVPKTLPPQIMKSSTLTLSYSRDDQGTPDPQIIEESGIIIKMIIDYTPLISPPADNDYTSFADTINQGNSVEDFSTYTFSNTGNVELQDVDVTLDISAAKYFTNGEFYYDEGAYGTMKPLRPLTYTIESVNVGLTSAVEFPNCLINKYLPPGLYKIPITYDAWYYDDGTIAGSTSWKMTNEAEYGTIFQATTGTLETPYLFVKVEDTTGFSGAAECGDKVEQGEQSANIAVTISNFEYYPLRAVKFSLTECEGLSSITTELSQSILVAANDVTGPGMAYLNFEVNVDASATMGTKTGKVAISGYDLSNNLVNTTFSFNYEILPVPALLTIVGVQTGQINPGKTFNLIVTVKNIGGSTATNVMVLLSLTNNLFILASPSEMPIASLTAGQQSTVNFTVKADKNIEKGATYTNFVYLKWTDAKANKIQYSDNAPAGFQLKTPENTEKSTFSLASSVLIAGIIVAVVILLFGLLVFLGIKSVASSMTPKIAPKTEPASQPKPPPPEPPAPKATPMHEGEKGPDMTPPPDVQEF